MPPDTPFLQPRLCSRKRVLTSQGQSTALAMARTSTQAAASAGRLTRGPSAAMYSFGGRAARIASNTWRVVAGRLNTRNNTALLMFLREAEGSSKIGNGFLQTVVQIDFWLPFQLFPRQAH